MVEIYAVFALCHYLYMTASVKKALGVSGVFRFSRTLYAACMSGLRGAKDVLFGKDRELKKK